MDFHTVLKGVSCDVCPALAHFNATHPNNSRQA